MKAKDIKNLSTEELKLKLAEKKAEYAKLKLAHKVSPIENPIQLRDIRKTIARLLTTLK
ncbi:50S ribosomal protein L29 [Apibacter muscae]|uniref:Large ribosomal subunit protein uL29 n=1 Tax=Apibacter muscae TaxID=2509004 RepID=A0A563DD19_9FLAO|nr:50S ribosomal protein L29 [Apibacter muscae]TWP27833.1 50S ribosomal protein L29 [Apibacter muscae]TWP29654.1 50S ribosomal protein L29 [Apibacter muscae]